jgi:hypothetical protein
MSAAGYGPDKPLKVKVAARNVQEFRDTSVILMDQLKQIGIDGDLDLIETTNCFLGWHAASIRSASSFRCPRSTIRIRYYTKITPAEPRRRCRSVIGDRAPSSLTLRWRELDLNLLGHCQLSGPEAPFCGPLG